MKKKRNLIRGSNISFKENDNILREAKDYAKSRKNYNLFLSPSKTKSEVMSIATKIMEIGFQGIKVEFVKSLEVDDNGEWVIYAWFE